MFGWEFPPHISGGLGTACYGLTRGLSYRGVEVVFVVPKAYGDEDQSSVSLVGASNVPVMQKTFNFYKDISEKDVPGWESKSEEMIYIEVGSHLLPYMSPEEFEKFASSPHHPLDHLGFLMDSPDSVNAFFQEVSAQGVNIVQPPKEHRDGSFSFYLADPDSNTIQVLFEPSIQL